MAKVLLNLNNPVFQQQLFDPSKNDRNQVLDTLKKLSQMAWEQVYKDRGLHWEQILSRSGKQGEVIYSIRITQSCRAVARRDAEWLILLALHFDHDSTYSH